jgi:hypothetical protein
MKGYKVFNPDFTCNGFRFEEGKTYSEYLDDNGKPVTDGRIKICSYGFHFCIKASHCFSYYAFDSNNIVCEVEALGETQTQEGDSKVCTNKIKILRRLSWDEVLKVSNDGANNTGYSNTGDRNTGDRNTGNWNTGNWNTGYRNTGNWNTGYRNTGDRNTGNWNTGYRNTGYSNTGNWNTGYRNTGDRNTGNWNTGDRNTGNWNTGDRNTGYSNTGDRNTGVFCTGHKTVDFFNKPSDWTENDFLNSKAYFLLRDYVETKIWVYPDSMTEEEKTKNPSWKTCDGYLKDIPFKEAFQNAWHNWNATNRKAFADLPNFDADIFFQITGVKI